MVHQLSSRPAVHAGTPAGACRGPGLLLRRSSTAVRCFKSNSSDDAGARSSTSLKLNFKVGYRVNFGQTIAMIGSGDALGNWDPKRSIAMKWTDGDWWTAELNVAPGSALDLEYKYVVVNSDGQIGYWKPGSNYKVTLPLNSSGIKVPKRVKVADAWDDSFKKVDVEEAEVAPASPSSNGASASTAAPPPPKAAPQPPKAAPQPPATASSSTSTSGAANAKASAAPPPPAPPPQAQQQPQQQKPPPSTQQQPAAAAQQASSSSAASSNGAGPAAKPQNGIPRATSPRSGAAPAGFAAITSIPAIHPTLMAEQERLEDGVKMSLEDLQNQMDKHQQLRERTDEAKLAAAEARASVLAEAVAALTHEVTSLKDQLSDMRALLTSTSELLGSVLRQQLPGSGSGGATQQVFVGAPGFAAFAMQPLPAQQQQHPHTAGGGSGAWWASQQEPQAGQYSPAVLQPWAQPAVASWAPAAAAAAVAVAEPQVVEATPVTAAQSVGGAGTVLPQPVAVASRRADARRTSLVRTVVRRSADGRARVAVLGRGLAARKAGAKAVAPGAAPAAHQEAPADVMSPAPTSPAPVVVPSPLATSAQPTSSVTAAQQANSSAPVARAAPAYRARAASAAARSASPVRAPMASAAKAAAVAAVLLPVVCGVGRGARRGARGRFNMQQYRDAVRARAKEAPACIELSAVKNEGVWADVQQAQQLTPTEFMQEAGLKGKNWKASIRVVENEEVGAALSEVLAQISDRATQ